MQYSTGSLLLDQVIGQFPEGRIIEIFGPKASGKTTLCLNMLERNDCEAAFIDTEKSFWTNYANQIGVNLKRLLVSQPRSPNHVLALIEKLLKAPIIKLVVVDSIPAINDSNLHVTLSENLRKFQELAARTKTTLVFTNQIRRDFNNKKYTPAGVGLPFYSSLRLELNRFKEVDGPYEAIGEDIEIEVKKNKFAPPFKKVLTRIYFGRGISKTYEKIQLAIKNGLIHKRGNWYYVDGLTFQGYYLLENYMRANS